MFENIHAYMATVPPIHVILNSRMYSFDNPMDAYRFAMKWNVEFNYFLAP